jgi:hypothetical protein
VLPLRERTSATRPSRARRPTLRWLRTGQDEPASADDFEAALARFTLLPRRVRLQPGSFGSATTTQKISGADGTRTRGLRRDSAEILPVAAPVYEPNGQFVDSCFGAAVAYLQAAQAGAVELPQLAALIEGLRYAKVPFLADLCQDIIEALRCGELELATSRGLRLATGAVQLGALLHEKTGTRS